MNPGMFLLRRYRYILLCFYYIATETYCSGSEFKYRSLSLKVNALSCWNMPYTKPNPKPIPTVFKCKTDIKIIFVDATMPFNFLICRFELLCRIVITRDSNQSSRLLNMSSYSVSYQTNLLFMKTHRYEAGYVRC